MAAALVLASNALACVEFHSKITLVDGYNSAQLYDGGNQICWYYGYVGGDGLYRFTCIAANYAAIQDQNGVVQYANPGGNYRFQATASVQGDGGDYLHWDAYEYGC